MKIWKIIVLVLVVLFIVFLISAAIETNYCHILTTTPPPNSPSDYIKTSVMCKLNANIAIPGIMLQLLFGMI